MSAGSLLASGSPGGQLIVWRLVHQGSEVQEAQVLNVGFSEGEGAVGERGWGGRAGGRAGRRVGGRVLPTG